MTTASEAMEDNKTQARHSFTGRTLTESQFEQSWALAGIMNKEIQASGSFNDKLTDFAHAFARSEKFDAMKGETIIRDIFKARYGQTMNQMREGLMAREDAMRPVAKEQALSHARGIEGLIRDGETMAFYQAYDRQSVQLASSLGITQSGAKTMMKDAYREVERRELYDTGKALEEQYHRPKIEAERAARESRQAQSQKYQRSR